MPDRAQSGFQIINTFVHGILDYGVGLLLLVVPYLLGFADGTAAQYVPQALGVLVLGSSIMTRYELSLFKLIPMPMHLMLDAGTAILLAASPWLFGFSGKVYLPHLIVGLGELLVVALSQTQPRRLAAYA